MIALIALALLLAAWVFYPLSLAVVARRTRPAKGGAGAKLPTVGIVIATRDNPDSAERRVLDIRRSRYPPELMDVVVAVDSQSPHDPGEYQARVSPHARVVGGAGPGGKAAALNAGVHAVEGDVLVFADVAQTFEPNAIAALVSFVQDERFGAATGRLLPATGDPVMDWYWKYELFIRRAQTLTRGIVTTSGAIQAVRRDAWRDLPPGLISDDLFVALQVAAQGLRAGYCPEARALDDRRFTYRQQFRRKTRTLTGLLQVCVWMPWVLLPWRNPLWPDLVLHKLARVATPFLLLVAGVGLVPPLLAAGSWVAPVALVSVVLAAAWRPRMLVHLAWLVAIQGAPVVATWNALRGRWDVWSASPPRG